MYSNNLFDNVDLNLLTPGVGILFMDVWVKKQLKTVAG